MDISYVIPVLNEEDALPILYQEIINANPFSEYEIIFIDDGSTDNSFQKLREIAVCDQRVKVIKFRRNFGKAAAMQYAFWLAQGNYVCTLDGDLQDDPKEIVKLLNKMNEGYDVVSGWKKKRFDPIYKTLPSKIFNFINTITFGLKLKDYNCGFKLYKKSVVKEITLYGEMHRFIPALANSFGYKVGEVAINHRPRQFGKSKYGVERYLRGFFDLLTVKMVTHYIKSPLYLFGRIGIISSVLGFIITLYLSIMKIYYGRSLTNRPLLFLGILLILAGLQFFSMGLICELIVNRSQSVNKNLVSIQETLNLDTEKGPNKTDY